ncbi:alanine racemase [Limnofasciculus baicalensis]|uniref:Alanine racemase n=1 Tax=Limnofasciculus baicalensis BBK-W-15 TaxID=2699891 RepID=A0AAE3KSV2_9CYAN|nr:alanine racemase [Limnofasciculus baicalensis]MCP2729857.1 alanine racemase [Limnofasciculus baicalensis BBK-W-15]
MQELTRQATPSLWDVSGGICQRAWVEIDLAALSHNVQQLRQILAPHTQLMAVVKADAYGHGATMVASTVLESGASGLCVATVEEGIQLREAGITAPILLLGATNTPQQVRAIAYWNLQPTICTPQQALIFSETLGNINSTLSVHLKIDTGMSRLGMPWEEATQFVQLVQGLSHLQIKSVYSHLATADSPDLTIMKLQQQRFDEAITKLNNAGMKPPSLHLANSAATLTNPALHYDLVRVGLSLYGLYPAPHLQNAIHLKPNATNSKVCSQRFSATGTEVPTTNQCNVIAINLKPVMQVKARVTQVKTISPGTGVSYGYRFIADRSMIIAVVGIGYADGIPRLLSNKMTVLIRGEKVRQIGSITMDQIMLDVTDIPDLQTGEVVTLIGNDGDAYISPDDWAESLGTISWEILCGFKHRLPRVAV